MILMRILSLILTVCAMGVSQVALAKSRVLVISDVDDTIKLSQVRSTISKGVNAIFGFKAFLGMADLYQSLSRQPETSVYYISNAPSFLMHSRHTQFLDQFNFPQINNLKTRPDTSNDNFKVETILQLVRQEEPEVLVLIGDNGEHDPRTFQSIRQNLASHPIYVLSFIHKVYHSVDEDEEPLDPLTKNEIQFVTPIEIGLLLGRYGLLNPADFQTVARKMIPAILSDARVPAKSRSFPEWKDCSYYEWSVPVRGDEPEGTNELKDLIKKRCGLSFNSESFFQVTSLEYLPDVSKSE